MSAKISKDAKMEYDKLISGRNFRQKDQIVRAYNESIKGYNNFRKAISRSNFNEAAQELSSAALKLAAAVEWAEKYVIFNKYSLLKQTEFDQSKIAEWDRRCRFVKVKDNKEQNMTTHDLMKIIKSDFKNEILKSGASFTNMDNEEVRCALINGYKHNGTEPDSSAYIQTMEELYKFINILILKGDEKNKLKGITDNYPNSWEELFISCGYFKPNRNRRYILLTGDINDDSGQFFKNVYGMKKLREMQSDEYTLAPMIKVGNDISGKKITFQLKYSLFTKEVLKYFSRGESVSFTSLSDRIINIIKYSRRDTDSEIDGETIKLLNKLFIEREGNQVENVINIKGVYSPLITQLVEENKRNNKNQYDDSENVVVNIFKALVEYYPEEPHFAGHLARYYFYTMHNYELGFEVINEAIESAKEKEQYSMGSLYHIKAMGYSARIQG